MLKSTYKREVTPGDGYAPRSYVTGPNGDVLTMDNLPSPRPGRWVARKKAEVIAAVRGGLISLDYACERYELSPEEFIAWQTALDRFGLEGLRAATRCGRVKQPRKREAASEPDVAADRAQALMGWP